MVHTTRQRVTRWIAVASVASLGLALVLQDRAREPADPNGVAVATSAPHEPTRRTTSPAAPTPRTTPVALPAPPVPATPTQPTYVDERSVFSGLGTTLHVSGRVLDEHGVPLEGADVHFLPRGLVLERAGRPVSRDMSSGGLTDRSHPVLVRGVSLDELPHTHTDAEGRFTLTGPDLAPINQGGRAVAPPWPELVLSAPGHATRLVNLLSSGGGSLELEDTTLVQASQLSGRVVDESGVPVADVFISPPAFDSPVQPSRAYWYYPDTFLDATHAATTDVDGRFRIDSLWAGEYQFQFAHDDYALRVLDPVVVLPGRETELNEVTLSSGDRITGRVLDAHGGGVPHATVFATEYVLDYRMSGCFIMGFDTGDDRLPHELTARWLPSSRSTVTNAYGEFGLCVPSGAKRTLYALAEGFGAVRGPTLTGEQRHLELRLPGEALLDVLPEMPDGVALPADARLTAERVLGERHPELPLRVSALPGGGFRVHDVGTFGTELTLEVPGMAVVLQQAAGQTPGTHAELPVVLQPEASASGRVAQVDGVTPAAGITVLALRAGEAFVGSELHMTHTDAEGRFRIGGLAAGRWKLVARTSAGQPHASLRFELRDSERLDDVELVLSPPVAPPDPVILEPGLTWSPKGRD